MKKRVRVVITGRVQGVGFRYFVKGKALELGVTGWVRNIENGVEGMFEGEEDQVDKLVKVCDEGPALSKVKKVKIDRLEVEGLKGFDILK